MSKLTKNITLRVPLKERRVSPALKIVSKEIGCLLVTVKATRCFGISRLETLEDRYDVEVIYIFFGAAEVSAIYKAESLLNKLHAQLLPLVAEEFEGKVQEVAA